jgi:hypothetical protein
VVLALFQGVRTADYKKGCLVMTYTVLYKSNECVHKCWCQTDEAVWQHLDKFATDSSRGPVLEKSGTSRRFRFRFRNPLLRPFIMMKGLAENKITGDLLEQLAKKQTPIEKNDKSEKYLFEDDD